MNARQRILDRLRAAPVTPLPAPELLPPATGKPGADGLSRLRACLTAAHAEVIDVGGDAWPAALAEVCARESIRVLMLPAAGIDLAPWPDAPQIRRFEQPLETHKDALFNEVDAGLTVADCALADTGVLVLRASPTQPRTLSLVPPIHICLVDARRLHADLPAALAAENWAAAMPSNLIFISGPSKTADIQQTLAYGAHGPKRLIVLLLDAETVK